MTRLSLLGERGVCLCSVLGLPLSPLHVCTIETGVEYCPVVGLWLLLSSSSSSSSSECSPPVAGSMSAKARLRCAWTFAWGPVAAFVYPLLELLHQCTCPFWPPDWTANDPLSLVHSSTIPLVTDIIIQWLQVFLFLAIWNIQRCIKQLEVKNKKNYY